MSAEPQPLGCCALCGDEVYPGEPFLRIDDQGRYACETCKAGCCVLCGSPEATTEHEDDDEPLCAACRYKHAHRADELYAEQQYRFYNGTLE